jgi:hypothetical protein
MARAARAMVTVTKRVRAKAARAGMAMAMKRVKAGGPKGMGTATRVAGDEEGDDEGC